MGNKGVLSKILTELKEAMRENMQRKKQKKAIKKEKQPRFLAEPPFTESELKFMKAVEKLNRLQKKLGKKAILKMAKKELEIEPYRFEGIIQELNETYCTLGLTRLAQLAGIPLD